MNKILIITGLTASGKSSLAIDIAKKFNGEIISADSVQIYKDLNIGSDKVTATTMAEIPHHLIDIKQPNETYNVGEFIDDCKSAISNILNRNKLPIIVGGTGLYVKALLEGYDLGGTKADLALRNHYEAKAKSEGNIAVWNELNKLNPKKAIQVHPNNLKRVIRYLEIEKNGFTNTHTESILKGFNVLAIGIIGDRETIYKKINTRVDDMLAKGLENEVKILISNGLNKNNQSMNSIGYKEWFDYFNNKTTKQQTIDLIKQHTRNYCKRQLTFLKTIQGLQLTTIDRAKDIIEGFLNDKN